jgi:hypothetical protein
MRRQEANAAGAPGRIVKHVMRRRILDAVKGTMG